MEMCDEVQRGDFMRSENKDKPKSNYSYNYRKMSSKIIASLMATSVLFTGFSTIIGDTNAYAANKDKTATKAKKVITNSAIEKKKAELKSLQKEQQSVKKSYSNLEDKILDLKDERQKLDNKMNKIEERTAEKQKEVSVLEDELSRLRVSMDSIQKDLDSRDEEFKERASSMYQDQQNGVSSLLNVFLNSDGLADLVSKLNSYRKIVKVDNQVIEEYIDLITQLKDKETRTKAVVSEINSKLNELKTLYKNVNETAKEKAQVEKDLKTQMKSLKSKIKTLNAQSDSAEGEIGKLIEKETVSRALAKIKKQEALSTRELAKVASSEVKISDKDLKSTDKENYEVDKKALSTINNSKKYVEQSDTKTYYDLITKYSKKYNIPSSLLKAVIQQESGFNAKAVNINTNGTVDRGLMQINSSTAPGLAKQLGWNYEVGIEFVPSKAIEMGAYYLSTLYVPDDLDRTLTSYNRGTAGAKRYKENTGSFASEYSQSVISYMKVFMKEEKQSK